MAEYVEELCRIEEVPAADDLVAGSAFLSVSPVVVSGTGEYKRGTVLMRSGDEFVPAALSGLQSAKEVCVLSRDLELGEDESAEVNCWFMGHFSLRQIVVEGKRMREYSGAEQSQITAYLREHKIFLR